MNPNDPDDIMDYNDDFARKLLMKDGDLAPLWIMHTRDGQAVPVATPILHRIEHPEELTGILSLIAVASDAWAVCLMATGNVSEVNRDGSDVVRRGEVVFTVLTGTDAEGEPVRRVRFHSVRRNRHGKVTKLEPFETTDDIGSGWVFDVITEATTPDQRRRATKVLAGMGLHPLTEGTVH